MRRDADELSRKRRWQLVLMAILAVLGFVGAAVLVASPLLGRRRWAPPASRGGRRLEGSKPGHGGSATPPGDSGFAWHADDAPAPMWTTGPDGKATDFNRAWLEFTGRTLEQEVGSGVLEVLHPDDVARSKDEFHSAFRARRELTLECRVRRHDGAYRWCLVRGAPRYSADGDFEGYVGVATDVTGLKAVEEAHRQAMALVDSWPDAITLASLDGTILSWNRGAERISGYSAAEMVGRWIGSFCPPERAEEVPLIMERIRRGETVEALPTVRIRRDGERIPVELTVSPVRGPDGEVTAAAAILRDVSGQVHAAEELAEHQRLVGDLYEAVSQTLFAAGLIADTLPRLQEHRPLEARRSVDELRNGIRGALAEMRVMLLELRPERLASIPLEELLRHLAGSASGRAPARVVYEARGEVPGVPTNARNAIYRIAQEALDNAARHAGASRVTLSLRGDARQVEVLIRDDGRGFDAGQPPAGRGLRRMRERAAGVGAAITIDSQIGRGTRVEVVWPATPRPDRSAEAGPPG